MDGSCARCQRILTLTRLDAGYTAGYYNAIGWAKYANPGEEYICDSCMWSDPRYIADYGNMQASLPVKPVKHIAVSKVDG